MNILFWRKSKVPKPSLTSENQKLEQIKKVLFPSLELTNLIGNDGALVTYHIDYCIDSALEVVLNDLQDGHNDIACQKTLNSVIKRLLIIRKILEIETTIHEDAEFIIVKDLDLDQDIEEIR